MDEDIARLTVAHDESIALGAIEPFDDGGFQRPVRQAFGAGVGRTARQLPPSLLLPGLFHDAPLTKWNYAG